MAKKVAAAKTATKPAKVAPKVAKPRNDPKEIRRLARVELVSFSCVAVIPTQQYGNLQPKIEVTAGSIEEARAAVMPVMEDLYKTYAEMPLNGRAPRFYGKVTEEVTVAVAAPAAAHEPNVEAHAAAAPKAPEAPEAPVAPAEAPKAAPAAAAKPEPVLKAEKAIAVAATEEAVIIIGKQIEASVKIPPEFKDELAVLVLKRRKVLSGK